MKKNAVVGQSGGPTAVINASLYGTVYEALNREDEIGTVYGMINGIEGFLNDQVMDMACLLYTSIFQFYLSSYYPLISSCFLLYYQLNSLHLLYQFPLIVVAKILHFSYFRDTLCCTQHSRGCQVIATSSVVVDVTLLLQIKAMIFITPPSVCHHEYRT